ncbi:DASH family cryptochrome [Zhongshania aquimaris]|uniref:Cryptochrome DASH n=1 Tax=Zhongshania aquimaris TaxID=2857107 RepID=A0ABS6VQY8_9GAMM|nr:DASH family cryptochrome [Zhongshania aquimaris]MBW2940121.1 DASH family cryptochrome [Zhongshania aquimaris]
MKKLGLYCFGNDLRLHDLAPLRALAARVDHLLCVVCVDPALVVSSPHIVGDAPISKQRRQFLEESVAELAVSLDKLGQRLIVCRASARQGLAELIDRYPVDEVYRSRHPGSYERSQWQFLQKSFPTTRFQELDSHTLFNWEALPFAPAALPPTFSQFRKAIADLRVPQPLPTLTELPPPPDAMELPARDEVFLALGDDAKHFRFYGGEVAGLEHTQSYFDSDWPSHYKVLRNDLDSWHHSTKFSPWLALGCVSAREIVSQLRDYEARHGANDSTEWIYFELLWREYFQWYAYQHGNHLFRFKGIKQRKPLTSFYPERFRAWTQGETPWPLVNACMHQINETAYMSNRGRQIVASCFVHELQLDWRYGAAYFEQQLIDYDMASNWGNWQYLAGVGADPRGHRRFDLEKQARQYDPDGAFTRRWRGGETCAAIDSQDMVGWPCVDGSKNQ